MRPFSPECNLDRESQPVVIPCWSNKLAHHCPEYSWFGPYNGATHGGYWMRAIPQRDTTPQESAEPQTALGTRRAAVAGAVALGLVVLILGLYTIQILQARQDLESVSREATAAV